MCEARDGSLSKAGGQSGSCTKATWALASSGHIERQGADLVVGLPIDCHVALFLAMTYVENNVYSIIVSKERQSNETMFIFFIIFYIQNNKAF